MNFRRLASGTSPNSVRLRLSSSSSSFAAVDNDDPVGYMGLIMDGIGPDPALECCG